MKATGDRDALRDELYQEMKDALETEFGVELEGGVDDIGWLELRLDRSADVINLAVDVIKSVMWMVTGEEPVVKFTAHGPHRSRPGAKVYNKFAVASPEMLPDAVTGTNTFSLVMRMMSTDESRNVKMTVGSLRRPLREVDDENIVYTFFLEELMLQLSTMYPHADVKFVNVWKDARPTQIVLHPFTDAVNDKQELSVFGDILQAAFDCLGSVTGDEPVVDAPHRGAGQLYGWIRTDDLRVTVMIGQARLLHGRPAYVTVSKESPRRVEESSCHLVKETSDEGWLETVKTLREEIMAYFDENNVKATWHSSGVPGFYAIRLLRDEVPHDMFDVLRSIVWMLTGDEPTAPIAGDEFIATATIANTRAIRISNASTYQSKYFDLGITVSKDRLKEGVGTS